MSYKESIILYKASKQNDIFALEIKKFDNKEKANYFKEINRGWSKVDRVIFEGIIE